VRRKEWILILLGYLSSLSKDNRNNSIFFLKKYSLFQDCLLRGNDAPRSKSVIQTSASGFDMPIIYKISPRLAWKQAEETGVFTGAPVDIQDGYIHFSAAHQVRTTVEKHFAGQTDLVLVCIPSEALGDALRWETSRGGDSFPHLYASLPTKLATAVIDLPMQADGKHLLPKDIP
jgi:uncharacterized protein (DUF952 family)